MMNNWRGYDVAKALDGFEQLFREESSVLSEINVEKEKLLETIRKNRQEHKEVVEEAKLGYIKEAKRLFQEKLDTLEKTGVVDNLWTLYPPKDHTKDYDQAISMLEWEKSDTITLSQQSFKHYVLDDWNWKESFLASNSKYSGKAAATYLSYSSAGE